MPFRTLQTPLRLVFSTFNGVVQALDLATGYERWRHVPSTPINCQLCFDGAGAASGEPILDDARLYVYGAGKLSALRASNGEQLWQVTVPDEMPAKLPEIRAVGEWILLGLPGEVLACAREDGRVCWRARSSRWFVP